MYTISDLFDLEHTAAKDDLARFRYPWEAISSIREMILRLGETLDGGYDQLSDQVWVHHSARIAPSACLTGPCIIGPETEVRHGAFIRGSVLIGAGCVAGNSTELKNAILFDGVQTPHYNYVGDSILGYRAHMGAGSITSNVKGDKSFVTVRSGGEAVATGLKKLGAMLGDDAEIGCNAVLNPGTVIGRRAQVYPLSSVRGTVPAAHIWKQTGEMVARRQQ